MRVSLKITLAAALALFILGAGFAAAGRGASIASPCRDVGRTSAAGALAPTEPAYAMIVRAPL